MTLTSAPGFNSTLVRLRRTADKSGISRSTSFQFHIGSIKTPFPESCNGVITQFQFHIGSIKTTTLARLLIAEVRFQFHIGSIKTRFFTRLCSVLSILYGFGSVVSGRLASSGGNDV